MYLKFLLFNQVVELDLASVVSSISGPKRPHDRVAVSDMKADFKSCLVNKVRYFSELHKGVDKEEPKSVIKLYFKLDS